jgi:nitrile hydratase subunit beta
MNSIHDMGGMHGFGAVVPEADEPVFHAPWEGRVYAMHRALGAFRLWTIDMSRASQEALAPAIYVSATYYQRWLLALEHRVVRHDLVGADEIAAGRSLRPGADLGPRFAPADADTMKRGEFARAPAAAPGFAVGETVRTRNINPATHTRLPRYARDKLGVVEAVRGCHVFPDAVTTGKGDDAQWLYTVVFDGRTLWGEDCDPSISVSIEAFEPYLRAP